MPEETWIGLYTPNDSQDGYPVAVVRDSSGEVNRLRRALGADVRMAELEVSANKDIVAQLEQAAPTPTADPDASRRAEIRARILNEERDARLEAEIREQMQSEDGDTTVVSEEDRVAATEQMAGSFVGQEEPSTVVMATPEQLEPAMDAVQGDKASDKKAADKRS
jgi:hypothetical protein